mgnify:CR=1 FL=1
MARPSGGRPVSIRRPPAAGDVLPQQGPDRPPGLRRQRPGPLHRQPPAQRLRYKNVEGGVYRPPHYYPSITPPAKAFGGKDVVQDLLTPVFTNC